MKGSAEILPPDIPELEREAKCRKDAQVLGAFVEWLQERHARERVLDLRLPGILYEYFGIDADKAETERRELLAYQRLINKQDGIRKELGLSQSE